MPQAFALTTCGVYRFRATVTYAGQDNFAVAEVTVAPGAVFARFSSSDFTTGRMQARALA